MTTTFTNSAPITINDGAAATPYPSEIAVSGLTTGNIEKVTATLHGFSHTCPHDVSVLLVSPTGEKSILFAAPGLSNGCPGSVNADLTFDDTAVNPVPYPPVTGIWHPSIGSPVPIFPAPAPSGPYTASLANFNGIAPNGQWQLFAVDSEASDVGSFSGGWSLSLTTPDPPVPPPPPSPPDTTCPTVTASAAYFTPLQRLRPFVPGVRAKVTVAQASSTTIVPTITYRRGGKSQTAALPARTLRNPGTRNLRVVLPGSLRRVLPLGAKVTLGLSITSTPDANAGCTNPSTQTLSVKTRVVNVLSAPQTRRPNGSGAKNRR